jgi:hypothetical protein
LGLIGLILCYAPVSADTGGRPSAPSTKASSSTTRVVWTLVGIGAGFGAGLFLGLHAFDDAINSDRKVWTSAIVGAAAGGLAGGLLSRNVGRVPTVDTSGSSGLGWMCVSRRRCQRVPRWRRMTTCSGGAFAN